MSATEKAVEKSELPKKKNVRTWLLVYSGLGGTIGGPIYVILGGTIKTAQAGVVVSLLLLGGLLLMLVMIYSELSLSIPMVGGGYSFSKEAIGGFWGFLIGWLMWLGNMTFCAVSAKGFGYSLAIFFPNSRGIIETNYIRIIGAFLILIYGVLNVRLYGFVQKMMRVFTFILILGFVVYIIVGIGIGPITNAANYNPSNLEWNFNIGTMVIVSPTLIGIFCLYEWSSSFESITSQAGEIKKAKKRVPRAFFLAISIAITIYVLVAVATLINMGKINGPIWDLISRSSNPLADTLHIVGGPFGMYLIAFAGMLCTMTSLQSAMQMSYHIFYAMSRDGYIPKIITKKRSKAEVSAISILISGVISILTALFIDLNTLVNISNFTIILSMGFLAFSVILLRRRRKELPRPYKVKGYPYVPIITGIICIILVVVISPIGILLSLIMIVFGVVVYSLKIARRDRIVLMLAGTKIAGAMLLLFLVFFSGNKFIAQNTIFKGLIESTNGIFLIIISAFSIISVIFDIRPLGQILRSVAKMKDSGATVVSQIVEIPTEQKKIVFNFHIIINIVLIIMSIVCLGYTIMFFRNTLSLGNQLTGIVTNNLNLIAIAVLITEALILAINGITGILLQWELRRARIN